MYTRKEPTYESGKMQAWGRTPLEVNTNSSFSFSIAVSVFSYPLFPMLFASFFSATTTLSFHSQSLSVSFLILFSQCSLLPSFLLPFVLCEWICGGWCGWGDYSSDQYCKAVGSSVNKMANVDGPSFPPPPKDIKSQYELTASDCVDLMCERIWTSPSLLNTLNDGTWPLFYLLSIKVNCINYPTRLRDHHFIHEDSLFVC